MFLFRSRRILRHSMVIPNYYDNESWKRMKIKPRTLFEIVFILLAESMLSPSLNHIALLREKTENM